MIFPTVKDENRQIHPDLLKLKFIFSLLLNELSFVQNILDRNRESKII